MQDITKELPCMRCGTEVMHKLVPSKKGASWKCPSCDTEVLGYTHKDMRKIVQEKFFKIKNNPTKIDVPEGLKVFLKHHGEGPDEMEAAQYSVKAHVEITGELPKVGKPMFAKPQGAHPMMAIPFGEVVRIEGAD